MDKILIVGGTGMLGSSFAKNLASIGHEVMVSDENTLADEARMLKECRLVIVCVPIFATPEVLARVRGSIRHDALLTDFTSVKSGVEAELLQMPCEVVSSHPLFGRVGSFAGQNIINIPIKSGAQYPQLIKLWESLGMSVTEISSCQEHDQLMSIVQGLTHMAHMVFASTLRQIAPDMEKLVRICSPVYRSYFAFASRILGGNERLYRSILMNNPFNKEMASNFVNSARRMESLIESQDAEGFTKMFNEDKEFLKESIDEFVSVSDYLVQKLSEHRSSDNPAPPQSK